MTEHNKPFSRDSQRSAFPFTRQIDRLVSGDLDESERLDLLAWLDESPDRWRRCGMAFLEAQSLREALAQIDPDTRGQKSRRVDRARRRIGAVRVGVGVIALLLAFLLGRGLRPGTDLERTMTEAETIEATSDGVEGRRVSESPNQIDALDDVALAQASGEDRVAVLRLTTGSGAEARELSVPVKIVGDTLEILERPAELPEYVRQQWERKGYLVHQQRRTIQLTLGNGRQLNVPVDQFMLTYVGRPML